MIKIEQNRKDAGVNGSRSRLKEVRFENARLTALGIEPMTLAELRGKVAPDRLAQPERIDFFMLMLVTAGHGSHVVDFVDWPLASGSLVFARPGQVMQWRPAGDAEAQLVLIAPGTLPHRDGRVLTRELEQLALDDWPAHVSLDPEDLHDVGSDLARLRHDFDRFDGSDLDISLIRHRLMALLLRIAKRQRDVAAERLPPASGSRVVYRLFLQALEVSFQQQHGLRHYAERLGYSESTLSRACLSAAGRPAKQVIDRRIGLEAQRLLAHSTASVAEIAHRLGFSETTNFVKFFRRLIGATPSTFRRSMRPEQATESKNRR